MAAPQKPWKAEYAKSARASCRNCKDNINKEVLRLGKMVQSSQFDGFMPVMEKQRLIEFADALRSKLNYFDELENIATSFYSPSMSVGNQNFLPLLKRLDECISYVESNPQYAESGVYLVKFRQLQSRALSMIRSHVYSVLKNASSQNIGVFHEDQVQNQGEKRA